MGRARQLCTGNSDLNSFCDLKGIVDLDAQVAHRTLNFWCPSKSCTARFDKSWALPDFEKIDDGHSNRIAALANLP